MDDMWMRRRGPRGYKSTTMSKLERQKEFTRRKEKFRSYFTRTKSVFMWLEWEAIELVLEAQMSNSKAEYRCILCRYYCNSLDVVQRHVREERHVEKLNQARLIDTASFIPRYPGKNQLRICLQSILDEKQLKLAEVSELLSVVGEIDNICKEGEFAVGAVGAGSIFSRIGAKGFSDTNVELLSPSPNALPRLADRLEDMGWPGVKRLFDPPFPKLRFQHPIKGQGTVSVTANTKERPVNLAVLFKRYSELDRRVPELCCLMRVWAEETGIIKTILHHTVYLLVIFYLQQLPKPVIPALADHNDSTNADWLSENHDDIATLWIEFFRFYAVDFDSVRRAIDVRIKGLRPRKTSGSGGRNTWISVIDPAFPNSRMAFRPFSGQWNKWIESSFATTFMYCALPQTEQGPALRAVRPIPKYQDLGSGELNDFLQKQEKLTSALVHLIPMIDENYKKPTKEEEMEAIKGLEFLKSSTHVDYSGLDPGQGLKKGEIPLKRVTPGKGKYKNAELVPLDADFLFTRLDPKALVYEMKKENLTGGRPPPNDCPWCGEEGSGIHAEGNCPRPWGVGKTDELDLECLSKQVVMTESWKSALEEALLPPPLPDETTRRKLAMGFSQWMEEKWKKNLQVWVFGSSANGFGVESSDMDICVTFKDDPTGSSLNQGSLVLSLFDCMCCNGSERYGFEPIDFIIHAKVPIVKFHHEKSNLQVDVSFYNLLAISNTRLLLTYSRIDSRVRPLVIGLKRLAKGAGIGDASKGGLSSYSFTLMVLAYLMRVQPPVIPCLQEIAREEAPSTKLGTPDTYFFKDLNRLEKVWPEKLGNNKESIGSLWISLLFYYAQEFDFLRQVITVRTNLTCTKLQLGWTSRCISIEDPFENRNLASGISPRMSTRIVNVFREAYLHFGINWSEKNQSSTNYFWNWRYLSNEAAEC